MKVLTVYAHPDPHSFCHGVLERFTAGLISAGHESQIVDLYAMGFDPVLRDRDTPSWTNGNIPEDIAELHDVRGNLLNSLRNPFKRWIVRRAIRGKSQAEICGMLRTQMPKDVLAMHEKIKWADGLAFIAPVHFCSFPAMLKGWIDRVWCYDFAFGLTPEGWHGDVNGRIPLLHHKRALIMSSTIFNKAAYDNGIRGAMAKVMDEWCFRYPGVEDANTSTSTRRPQRRPTWSTATSNRPTTSDGSSGSRHHSAKPLPRRRRLDRPVPVMSAFVRVRMPVPS